MRIILQVLNVSKADTTSSGMRFDELTSSHVSL